MAGTKDQAIGLQSIRVQTLLSSASTPQNSLEGLDPTMLAHRSLVWVEANATLYRWDDTSTATANADTVVRPTALSAGDAGRFIRIHNGVIGYDTLTALNADPAPFDAEYVALAAMTADDDGQGGLFRITSGLTPDGVDYINLTGAHAGKQLQRSSNFFAFGAAGILDNGGTTTDTVIGALNTVRAVAADSWFGSGDDFTLDSGSGILTSARRRTYAAVITSEIRMQVLSPASGQVYQFFVDRDNASPVGGSTFPIAVERVNQINGEVNITAVSSNSLVGFGTTWQLKVVQVAGAVSNLRTISNIFRPLFTFEFRNSR